MPPISIQIHVGANANAQTIIAGIRNGLASLQGQARSTGGGFRSAGVDLDGLLARFVGFEAALRGFRAFEAFIQTGLGFNRTIETANLGIATLITAQAQLHDSQGRLLQGTDALRAAQGLAAEQVRELRIAGLQTAATTQELVQAYQQAVGIGLRYNLTLSDTRKLTIGIVQAAGALGVPMNQLNEEIRSFLAGTITAKNTRVATALGITNEDIRRAQQTGTLAQFIIGRLQAFNIAGVETAKTWAGVTSNIREAFEVFAGDATEPLFEKFKAAANEGLRGVFDLTTAQVSEKFSAILTLGQRVFGGLGDLIADAIRAGVRTAEELNGWLVENQVSVDLFLGTLGLMVRGMRDLLGTVVQIVAGTLRLGVEWKVFSSLLAINLVAAAAIKDVLQAMVGVLGVIGGAILTLVLQPIRGFLNLVGQAVALFDETMAAKIFTVADQIQDFLTESAAGVRAVFTDLAGDSALVKTVRDIRAMAAAARDTTVEVKALAKSTGDVTLAPNKRPPDFDAIKKSAAAATVAAKSELSLAEAKLKESLDANLVSYEDYYAALEGINNVAIQKQIAAQRSLLAGAAPEDQAGILATIEALENQRAELASKFRVEREKDERELQHRLTTARVELLKAEGKDVDAALAELHDKYDRLIQRLEVEGDEAGASLVRRLFNAEAAKVQFDAMAKRIDDSRTRLAARLQDITDAEARHGITASQAADQTKSAYEAEAATIAELLPTMRALAAVTGDPKAVAAVAALAAELDHLSGEASQVDTDMRKLTEGLRDATTNELANFLATVGRTNAGIAASFTGMVDAVVGDLQRLGAQLLATAIMEKILGSLGFSDFFSNFSTGGPVQRKADGGMISGPGTGTSDSIPALLSNGEYVINARATRALGRDMLDALNFGVPSVRSMGRVPRYASGGFVAPAAGGAGGGFDATIGLDDGLIVRMLSTRAGTKAVVNAIAENRRSIRALLGG